MIARWTSAAALARFSVNPEFASWRPLHREPTRSRKHIGLSPARPTSVSCKDTSTREDLGVREEDKGDVGMTERKTKAR